jgi:N-acyl-D-amino-acid deacylase
VRGQFSGRPVGVLMGWETTVHPFTLHPEFRRLARLPRAEMLAELRRPETRAAFLATPAIPDRVPEDAVIPVAFLQFLLSSFQKMFPLGAGEAQDYEPAPERSLAARAAAEGRSEMELAYDAMMEDDGHGLLYFPLFGYAGGDFEAIRETMQHPQTGLSLADGGAHCGAICDAGIPTFMLTHWARDRRRGQRLPLEFVVKRQTWDTAQQYGLGDRGRPAAGFKADVNVIDYDRLALTRPEVRYDLPAGGRRLFQGARGYAATLVGGVVTFEDGEPTGALPGRLLRGARGVPPA